jgi:hypothetical protein
MNSAPISNRESIPPSPRVAPTKLTNPEQISNREPLRLEIDVTPTKQTSGHLSNREKVALFQNFHQPVPRLILKNSNREPLRLEIDVTPTKQTPGHLSNRENAALLRRGGPLAPPGFRPSVRPSSFRPPPARSPARQNSNREPLRLEIDVTPTKQTPGHLSNREKVALFTAPLVPTRIAALFPNARPLGRLAMATQNRIRREVNSSPC